MKIPLIPLLAGSVWLRSFTADISTEWLVGSARIKITLDSPGAMSGYAGLTKPFKSIVHNLWAKALVLEDSICSRFAVITTDLSGI